MTTNAAQETTVCPSMRSRILTQATIVSRPPWELVTVLHSSTERPLSFVKTFHVPFEVLDTVHPRDLEGGKL
jgi:hypothetical protein